MTGELTASRLLGAKRHGFAPQDGDPIAGGQVGLLCYQPGVYFMPITILILVLLILAVVSAVAGFLTKRRVLYVAALLLGLLAVLMSIGIALALSRM